MSDRFTSVQITGVPGYAARGHISYAEAIEQARRHYEYQLAQAEIALTNLRKGYVQVFQQTGLYRAHNRKLLSKPEV